MELQNIKTQELLENKFKDLKTSQEKLKSLKVLISSKKDRKFSIDFIATNLMKEKNEEKELIATNLIKEKNAEKETTEEFKDPVESQNNDLPFSNTPNEEKFGLGVKSFTPRNAKFKKKLRMELSTILSLPENSVKKID